MKGPLFQDTDYRQMKSRDSLKNHLLKSGEGQFNLLAPKSYWAALTLGLLLTASLFLLVEKSKVSSWEKYEGVIKSKTLIEAKLDERIKYNLKGRTLKINGKLFLIKDVSDSSSKMAFITLKKGTLISGSGLIHFELRKSTSLKNLFLRT